MSRNKRITVLLDKECPIDAGNPISHRSPYDIITLPRPIASRKSHRRLQQISRRNRTRLGNRFNFQILQKTRSISLRILKRPQMAIEQTSSTSRLHDDALEQTIVHRRDTLRQRACGPCGLAEHGNVRRIATKQGNIVLYPLNAHRNGNPYESRNHCRIHARPASRYSDTDNPQPSECQRQSAIPCRRTHPSRAAAASASARNHRLRARHPTLQQVVAHASVTHQQAAWHMECPETR